MMGLTVSPGFSTIEDEFEASLRKAFVIHRARKIVIDSRRYRFQLESAAFGVEKGWLDGGLVEYDEQSSAYEYRLTDAGKKHFGIEVFGHNPGPSDPINQYVKIMDRTR